MSRFPVFTLALLAAGCLAWGQQTSPQTSKKRVAVLNFDYSTVQGDVASLFGTNQDIGKGIADLLVDRLVTDGRVSVIERKALDKVVSEQNFSNSDRADATSAAKLGRILGVDAIVIGSITQFGRDDKSTNVGGGLVGGLGGRYGLGGIGKRQAKAVVGISARVVSTDTAEVLAVSSAKGESTRSGTSLLGSGGKSITGSGDYDLSSKNFGDTILGEAVGQAVTGIAGRLEHELQNLPTTVRQVSGLIADVSPDNTIVLNVGTRAGVKVGDTLQVRRSTREIKDPATGKTIRKVEDTVGTVTITEADELSAVGKFSGSMPAKVGDTVRTAQ